MLIWDPGIRSPRLTSTDVPRVWSSCFWDRGTRCPWFRSPASLFRTPYTPLFSQAVGWKDLQQWVPFVGDKHGWLLYSFCYLPRSQEKQRETTVKTLLTTAKHLLMLFLCRTERGTGEHGMRKNSSQTSLPPCRKGPTNPYTLAFTPSPSELLQRRDHT